MITVKEPVSYTHLHPAWAAADSVFCYVGRRGEIDTRPLLRAALEAGKTLAIPL